MKQAITVFCLLCLLFTKGSADNPNACTYSTNYIRTFGSPSDSTETQTNDSLTLSQRIEILLDDEIFERTQVGIYIYDLTADSLIFAHHAKQCMRPASNQKLVTAITALHTLGTGYHYQTELWIDGETSDSTFNGTITIRAGYDPLFDKSDMEAFIDSLKAQGIKQIAGNVRFDLSFKDSKQWGWGWCWDDDETPLTPLLYDNRDRFADKWRESLRRSDILWTGNIDEAELPSGSRLICARTHSIDQALLPMMKESNNSIAESMFYQIATANGNKKVGRKRAVKHINTLVKQLDLDPDHYQFADGSGLSLYNYLTPELLGRLLRFAYNNERIYKHLLPSLPVAGEDGTLRKRMRGSSAEGNVHAKTGTVEGVSTLSGYCTAANGHTLCFSIMNQGIRHTSTGRNFQDRVCKALCR